MSENFSKFKVDIFDFISLKLNELTSSQIIIDSVSYSFQFIGCAADNLAAHELLGMSSFSASHCCRFCSMSQEEAQHLFRADKNLMRSKSSLSNDYSTYLILKSKNKLHVNGVNGPYLLSKLSGFTHHPFSFISCISHDLFEKIIPEFITTLIARMNHDRLLNSDLIYQKLSEFNYTSSDKSNPINFYSNLSSLSASQGRRFFKTYLLALKDFLPYNHQLFKGFITLNRIIDMVYSPFFFKSWFKKLEDDIFSFLSFVRIDLNLKIYPKMHFMIHYPELIAKYGPLRYLSTDQFESAHRHFKDRL